MAVKKEKVELSDYELQRQEKIAANQALLRQLQLDAASAGIAPSKPNRSTTSSNNNAAAKKKKPVQKIKEEVLPRRTSSRLKGIVADSEVAKRKAEDEADAFQVAEKAKRQRVSGDLNLDDIVVAGRAWNQSGNFPSVVGPARPGERTFSAQEAKDTNDEELRALREKMSGLELWEGFEPNRIKITPERIYSMGFHPNEEKPLVFAGDKLGNLGLFDGSQKISEVKAEDDDEDDADNDDAEPAITTFKIHTRTISAFQFSPHDQTALYSASYDSSIRKLDLVKGTAIQVYAPLDPDNDEPLSGVEISRDDPHTLYFTTLNGQFGFHDTRAPSDNTGATTLMQLSDKKIGGFSLHPARPHLVATASLDRTLKLWDLRLMSGGKKGGDDNDDDRLPALVGEHESRLSVSHAAFNSAGQVATASYDDTVKIYDFGGCGTWEPGHELSAEEMKPTSIVPHNNQTGRWVTM